jgi:ketosteroid isomerase-like protein
VANGPIELARSGFEAWRNGDFETVEALLDPDVQWRAFEPGEWDCRNREDVMETIRERYAQGFAKGEVTFRGSSESTVVAVTHPSSIGGPDWPDETATVMTFRGEKVVSMQDYRTEAEALAATGQA